MGEQLALTTDHHPSVMAAHVDFVDVMATERDPALFVRWVCPALRVGASATGTAVPLVDVALRRRLENWRALHG